MLANLQHGQNKDIKKSSHKKGICFKTDAFYSGMAAEAEKINPLLQPLPEWQASHQVQNVECRN